MRAENAYAAVVPVGDELLTRKDVARICQVSVLSVIRWQQGGRLSAIVLGAGSIRYRRADVEALINASKA